MSRGQQLKETSGLGPGLEYLLCLRPVMGEALFACVDVYIPLAVFNPDQSEQMKRFWQYLCRCC